MGKKFDDVAQAFLQHFYDMDIGRFKDVVKMSSNICPLGSNKISTLSSKKVLDLCKM